HRLGFVHRDLKPANIMLTEELPGIESVKILDFGVVGMKEEPTKTRLTGGGSIIGTPTYMAPEQGHDAAVTPLADSYSLGVILFDDDAVESLDHEELPPPPSDLDKTEEDRVPDQMPAMDPVTTSARPDDPQSTMVVRTRRKSSIRREPEPEPIAAVTVERPP